VRHKLYFYSNNQMREGGRWLPWIDCNLVDFNEKNQFLHLGCVSRSSLDIVSRSGRFMVSVLGLAPVRSRGFDLFSSPISHSRARAPAQFPVLSAWWHSVRSESAIPYAHRMSSIRSLSSLLGSRYLLEVTRVGLVRSPR
jgi:hypothetical protein